MDAAPLTSWDNFYVIVGSSASALTGLQFVVMMLAADAPPRPGSGATVNAFGTPNVVHFSAVLLLSAVLSAPWPSLDDLAIVVALSGLAGVIYALIVIRRARTQTGYTPVLEDWIWDAVLPLVAYGGLSSAAVGLARAAEGALFTTAAALLLLLFVGIHNAWDTVTYLAAERIHASDRDKNSTTGSR
jgi:hypothetical protein